jgi:hypothetical protein
MELMLMTRAGWPEEAATRSSGRKAWQAIRDKVLKIVKMFGF